MHIQPGTVSGTIAAPPSKSYTHRAILLAVLASGTSHLRNTLFSEDTLTTLTAVQKLGAHVTKEGTSLTVQGTEGMFAVTGTPVIDCVFSGTTARLITAIAALSHQPVTITGQQRLRERPMEPLLSVLTQQGVHVTYGDKEGHLPVSITGGLLQGGIISMQGNVSSQFISALLLISPFTLSEMVLEVRNLTSSPYVDITCDLMKHFGVTVERTIAYGGVLHRFRIASGQRYKGTQYTVEGDFSSASYLFAAAAITGSSVTVTHLNTASSQGDKQFLSILSMLGARIEHALNTIRVSGKIRHGATIDMGKYPDLVPTLAIAATSAADGSPTHIGNIAQLREKESDRIAALCTELVKMGIRTEQSPDSLTIYPGKLQGAAIRTYNDHRIAMSFAIAALAAESPTIIKNANVVDKSYPDFWNHMKRLGVTMKAN